MKIKIIAAKDLRPGDRTYDNQSGIPAGVVEDVSTPFHGQVMIKLLGETVVYTRHAAYKVEIEAPDADYEGALRDVETLIQAWGSKGLVATNSLHQILRDHGIDPDEVLS